MVFSMLGPLMSMIDCGCKPKNKTRTTKIARAENSYHFSFSKDVICSPAAPNMLNWYILSMKTAQKMMVSPATTPNVTFQLNNAFNNSSSPGKPFVNGTAVDASTRTRNETEKAGANLAIPPSFPISQLPYLL